MTKQGARRLPLSLTLVLVCRVAALSTSPAMSLDAAFASVSAGAGGQPRLVVTSSSGAALEVYLLGATATSFRTAAGQELLFRSSRAVFDGSKAIRGGIPVAFPQFAAQGPLPQHGLARTLEWAVESAADGSAALVLADSPATRSKWDHAFQLRLRFSFDGSSLGAALEVRHPGPAGAEPFQFEALLHTYLATGGGRSVGGGDGRGSLRVHGLGGATYVDKPSGGERRVEPDDPFALVGEVDRVFLAGAEGPAGPGADVVVSGLASVPCSRVRVHRTATLRDEAARLGAIVAVPSDVVVWNPGAAKCAMIADLGPEDWHNYVCVEPGVVSRKVSLAPGRLFTLTQRLTCEA